MIENRSFKNQHHHDHVYVQVFEIKIFIISTFSMLKFC